MSLDSYYIYDNFVIEIKGKVHGLILLFLNNYKYHIIPKHPEISICKIINILTNPDYIFLKNRFKDAYYEKTLEDGKIYRVILTDFDSKSKIVVTSYAIDYRFHKRPAKLHCVYAKDEYILKVL